MIDRDALDPFARPAADWRPAGARFYAPLALCCLPWVAAAAALVWRVLA